ncbi:GTPase-associated protein 1-related protein [Streptomyces californicus]|uniref:GTPase-associated protein 1-related protein n=1 Tax=Streptomyces californicus TaxID=67351 RepID=UPI0037A07C2F
MSLEQLHYTSAPPGPDGSGFRFTALTPGLPPSVLREAEQIIGYEPPRNAPSRPTDAELAEFPRAFSYSELSDGSRLLARTVYTGADYSGRWGNFHAHAVHVAAGQRLPDRALPISAWESPAWAVGTPASGAPPALAALPPSPLLDPDGLVAFAVSREPSLAAVFTDLQRQAEEETAPQVVLVEGDSADVARWVALASAALPPEDAHRLTFTTYTRRPHLSGQRIIGVLPDDAHGLGGSGRRYRVHDGSTRPAQDGPEPSAWAVAAARVWAAGAFALFRRAHALAGEPYAAGPLAALALGAGIELPPPHRAAAARWVCEHPADLGGEELDRLVRALAAPREERTPPAETAALADLFARVGGGLRAETAAPLAARLLVAAVRSPEPLRAPGREALTDEVARRLAAELGPELRAGIEDPADGFARPLRLLRVAGRLGVDCSDLVPPLARRLASALVADPSLYGDGLDGTRAELPALHTALLRELDEAAQAGPAAVTVLLERAPLSPAGGEPLPYLRMCVRAARRPAGGVRDRVAELRAVLEAAGTPVFARPSLLPVAVRLVWGSTAPAPEEARHLLAEQGAGLHRAAKTWPFLVTAAFNGRPEDPQAEELAHELLAAFPEEFPPRDRAALLLLEFARDLRAGGGEGRWVDRVRGLRGAAEPVAPGVLDHVFGSLAQRLLADPGAGRELDELIRYDDADLCSAYERAARQDAVRSRLLREPEYVADLFVCWNAHPQAGGSWGTVRHALLDEVLRPAVRALAAEDLAAVEADLVRRGARYADDFGAWNRPGALGRFGFRFGGRDGRAGKASPRRRGFGERRGDGGAR